MNKWLIFNLILFMLVFTGCPPKQDCIKFDPGAAAVQQANGNWKVVVGGMWLLDFGNSESEAREALAIIKHYRMDKQCFVGRPDPSMEYYLVKDKAPTGYYSGEDCIGFDPGVIEVKEINGRWKIVEGNSWLLDFENKEDEARHAYRIITYFKFRKICFVGRPDASMTYFLR
jgi:hypothetical protein